MKRINILILIWLSSFSGTCQSKIDLCDKKSSLANLEEVRKNARALISEKSLKSQDNCVLEFIDTLTNGFITNQTKEYITTLDAICLVRDGYVAEYFVEIIERLTFESFVPFIEYLSLQKEGSCFEKELLEIMKWKLNDGSNPRKDRLINLIEEKLKSTTIKAKTKIYLESLRRKLE
jgi:hypothetical protein